jgi:preprotein translocase subunit SecB
MAAEGVFIVTTTNGGQNPAAPPAAGTGPQLNVLAQYIKDLSFENPNAPTSLMPQQQQPAISIQVNVNPKQMSATEFEVQLKLEGKAEIGTTVLFSFDLLYAGVFRLQNIPPENLGPLVMIECPRLLFPFAREIVASAISHGGFPPLLLEPIDFVALYRQNLERQQQAMPQQV